MAQRPSYLLAPNFHFKPGTGPIALGSIIADPLQPHRAVTSVDEATLRTAYPRVEKITDENRSITRGSNRNVSMAVWAQFVQVVSAKLSGEHSISLRTNYAAEAMETQYFVTDPTLDVIKTRIESPRVQAVIKASGLPGFRHPVYMVTGLVIAKGFTILKEKGRNVGGGVEVSGDVPTPAGDIGLGMNVAKSAGVEESDTWKASEDIVFAYQLLKIEIKGWKGTEIQYDELRHKAAYLSNDDDEDEVEDDEIKDITTRAIASVDDMPSINKETRITSVEVGEGEGRTTCIIAG
ncbi:MAG: hypothetical protein Q9160_006647 [Pyrenula sp. 1 TL-2023]